MMRPLTVQGPAGFEWPHAVVDAPDAYYSYARVRVNDLSVTVFDQRSNVVGEYTLDTVGQPAAGSLMGMVGGVPFTISRDCNCGHGYGKKDKG